MNCTSACVGRYAESPRKEAAPAPVRVTGQRSGTFDLYCRRLTEKKSTVQFWLNIYSLIPASPEPEQIVFRRAVLSGQNAREYSKLSAYRVLAQELNKHLIDTDLRETSAADIPPRSVASTIKAARRGRRRASMWRRWWESVRVATR